MNQLRYVRGDTAPVFATPASATVIEIGDLIYLAAGAPLPASSLADQGSEAANQEAFHDCFLGVAEQQSRNGDTDPIRVATAGEFRLDCDAAAFGLGDLIGATENVDGDGLEDQKVVAVDDAYLAIGRAAEDAGSLATGVTSICVRIQSTVMTGGPQEPAAAAATSS